MHEFMSRWVHQRSAQSKMSSGKVLVSLLKSLFNTSHMADIDISGESDSSSTNNLPHHFGVVSRDAQFSQDMVISGVPRSKGADDNRMDLRTDPRACEVLNKGSVLLLLVKSGAFQGFSTIFKGHGHVDEYVPAIRSPEVDVRTNREGGFGNRDIASDRAHATGDGADQTVLNLVMTELPDS